MKKAILLLSMVLFFFSACESDEIDKPEMMTQNQQTISAFIQKRNKAMIERDIETLSSMMDDNLILVHMSGATQTKKEWLDEIANETMRYYGIETQNLKIEIKDNHAVATYISVIDARIWGVRGTWRMNITMHLLEVENGWLWSNPQPN